MTAITLRNLPPELAGLIEAKARSEKRSLNQTVIRMLEEAVALGSGAPTGPPYTDLDPLAGSLTQEEADELEAAIRDQRQIDHEMWR